MKKRNQLLRYNMQFFADKGDGDGDGADKAGEGDDNQDDEDQDDKGSDGKDKKSDKNSKGKMYTQEEIDEMITERLKRERKKAEKKQEQAKDDKQSDKDSDKSKEDDNSKKLTALEEKVLCYDHDVAKEYVKEAIALAKAYVDEDTDMDEALDKVIKKFPQFAKGSDSKKKKSDNDDEDDEDDTDNKKAWGQRQKGSKQKDLSDMSYEEYKKFRQGK
ncbi:MAG TPA: hypothetical protein VN131_06735 [Mobilitalea sp.]|nr:hypothetical protein [Mobilitalea sp.]